ncbi:DEAD/DEAH box helicase [Acidithiobacillus sp. MC6.1]|nr:DEAD/DEAH box helicase [Acidithiobacillus sp. MC6.1]
MFAEHRIGKDGSHTTGKPQILLYLAPAMIRRTKDAVLPDLPSLVEQVIQLEDDGSLTQIGNREEDCLRNGATFLQELERLGRAVLDHKEEPGEGERGDYSEYQILRAAWSTGTTIPEMKGFIPPPLHALAMVEMIRQRLGAAKAASPQAIEIMEDMLEERGCMVIFTVHHATSDSILATLGKKWKVSLLDGRLAPPKRQSLVDDFQAGKLNALIVGMDAGGEGFDMYHASDCLFIEMAVKPSILNQAHSRLRRMGQKSAVNAVYLVADNPIDRFLRELCLVKADLTGDVLDEEVSVLGETRGHAKEDAPVTNPEPVINPESAPVTEDVFVTGLTGDVEKELVTNRLLAEAVTNTVPVTNTEPETAQKQKRKADGWESRNRDLVRKQTKARVTQHRKKDPAAYREYMREYMRRKRQSTGQ